MPSPPPLTTEWMFGYGVATCLTGLCCQSWAADEIASPGSKKLLVLHALASDQTFTEPASHLEIRRPNFFYPIANWQTLQVKFVHPRPYSGRSRYSRKYDIHILKNGGCFKWIFYKCQLWLSTLVFITVSCGLYALWLSLACRPYEQLEEKML